MGFLKFFRFKTNSKLADSDDGCYKTRFRRTRRNLVFCNSVSDDGPGFESGSGERRFSWGEIESGTGGFSTVVGSGGFSRVYLARLPARRGAAAVKILGSSERLNRMFKQELEILVQVRHRNIVGFVGFCDERDEGALVFEYVPNGTLQEKLHGGANGRPAVLPWKIRTKIAFQLASAIQYLHEHCTLQIVHGDIKSSNILLDQHLNCKLCDFGSAKMGFSSTVANPPSSPSSPFRTKLLITGSPGYADPLYLRTGIASKKNDVYSYGVVLLELVTGIEAFCEEEGRMLTSVMAPVIRGGGAVEVTEMVDPRLGGDFEVEEARALVSIASLCLSQAPSPRPSIGGVLQMMRERIGAVAGDLWPEKQGWGGRW